MWTRQFSLLAEDYTMFTWSQDKLAYNPFELQMSAWPYVLEEGWIIPYLRVTIYKESAILQ